MDKSRSQYSFLNITTSIGGYFVNTIIGFVCRIIFVRCLSEDYLGINGLLTNILSMLSLAELGIGSAIGYALYKPLAEDDYDKIASLMKFYGNAYKMIGVIIGVVGVALLPFMGIIVHETPNIKENFTIIYLIYLFNTASTYFFSYRTALLMTAQQTYIVSGLSYMQTILQSVLQIIWLLKTKEYYGYLIIQTIGIFIYNIIISKITVKKYPYINQKEIKPISEEERKQLISNVRDLTIYKLSGLLVNSTDNIIITVFDGLSGTGLTSNYTLFTGTLTTLLTQIFSSVSASIGNFNALYNSRKREKMFNNFNMANFELYGWASIGVLCVSSDLVRLCYGAKFVMPITIPVALAINMYMVGMQAAVWTFKNTQGIFRHGRFMQCFTAMLNIVFSIIFGKKWGVFGVLFASAVARGLTNTWYDPYCIYKYGFNSPFRNYIKRYLKFLILELVCAMISFIICSSINLPNIESILAKCIVCTVVFYGISFLLLRKREEMSFIFEKVRFIAQKIVDKHVA